MNLMKCRGVVILLACQSSNKPSIPTRHTLLQGFTLRLQQDQDQSDRLSTLIDISFELVLPYSDLRPNNSGQLTISDTFWLLTGETPSTLKLGRRVQATITGLSGQAAYCSLPDLNDMEAVILAEDISSSGTVRPGDRLRRGDTVPARSVCAFVTLMG